MCYRYELCKCPCPPDINKMAMTTQQLSLKVQELERNLTVDVSQLSHTTRQLTCADDHRVSSVSLGSLAAALLSFTFGSLVVMDVGRVYKFIFG